MFKSIFKKLLVTFLTIIIIGIAVLSVIISFFYSQYAFEQKQAELERAGHSANLLMNRMERSEITIAEVNAALDSLGYVTDSKIYVIRLNSQSLDDPSSLRLSDGLEESYLLSDLKQILNGVRIFRQKQYSREFDTYVLVSGIPWETSRGIAGAILLFSPVSELNSNITRLNLIIWSFALLLILLSAFVIYYNSRRISRPIKEMATAADRLSSGINTGNLTVQGQDEISILAKSFNSMKQQLQNTEKMRQEFIANVSHDMRTPLTSINGFVGGMLDGIIHPKDYTKYLTIIKDETTRLTLLTNEILHLAKIQSGSLTLTKEPILAKELLQSVIHSVQGTLKEKSIQVHLECDPSIKVDADRDKLMQILINLVDNAAKYNHPNGEIRIEVSSNQSGTTFTIQDTGIGIAAEDSPYIFEKFYRADKSRQAGDGSTGLGLNIAKSLIELHGGTIQVESVLGSGTTMIFFLP